MTHSTGPWRVGDAGHTVFGPPNGTPSPQTIASDIRKVGDSRLIAAAPDLLLALQAILSDADGGWMRESPIARQAKQAIAKAS